MGCFQFKKTYNAKPNFLIPQNAMGKKNVKSRKASITAKIEKVLLTGCCHSEVVMQYKNSN